MRQGSGLSVWEGEERESQRGSVVLLSSRFIKIRAVYNDPSSRLSVVMAASTMMAILVGRFLGVWSVFFVAGDDREWRLVCI